MKVRLDTTVSSRSAQVGDVVPGSLAEDVLVDGPSSGPSGCTVAGRVTYARRSGRIHHPCVLTIRLSSIEVDGHPYHLESTPIRDKGHGHTDSNLEKIGGGAGIGTIIGAIAGGGRGGLLGAGAGTRVAAATGR